MRGNNVIVANAATVVEAMQEYLDRRAIGGKSDKVESVSYAIDSGQSTYRFFLSERKSGAT